MLTLSIIIPCYNEEKTIEKILNRIEKARLPDNIKKEIIIVDDGSVDKTKEILSQLKEKYKIIYHQKNQGKGAAIKTGLKYASGEYVIVQDADLEYDPRDYQALLECALKNNAEVVYGSRRLNPHNKYSAFSFYLGGRFLTRLTNVLYGTKITDEATGYKMFKTETIKNINLKSKGFEFCPEITAKIAKKKIKIFEVPINYYPRSKKEGKKINWKDGIEAVWTLIKYKFI